MKRLWVSIFLGLLLIVPPFCIIGASSQSDSAIQAEVPPVHIRRVYGENLAAEIYSDVSTTEYRDLVMKFTENGSRWIQDYTMASRGTNLEARNYLIQQMQQLSNNRMEVNLTGEYFNIVGKLPGYLPGDNPVIVVAAHYDSPQWSPGANGDGSGIAAVLSLVRMLSKYEWPLDIYFIAFNGLYTFDFMSGSPEVALYFQLHNIDILSFYNLDTLLVPDPDGDSSERIEFGYANAGQANYHKYQYWAELARMMSNNYGSNMVTTVLSIDFPLWETSDHVVFFERGFSGVVCASESGHAVDGNTGTPTDYWNNVEFNYNMGRETTGVIGASIAFTMSREYGAPNVLEYSFSEGPSQWKVIQIAVTTPTIMNVSSRWFGGTAQYLLFDPEFSLLNQKVYNETSPWEATEVLSEQLTMKGTYYLVIQDTDIGSVGFEVSITYDSDIDGNGILDRNEYWLDQSYYESDQDGDTLSDAEEILLGTDMYSIDSDQDSMPDNYELEMGFDPRDASDGNEDADLDGLTNAQEYIGGLNPFSADSDNDMIDDLWELTYGLDPLNPDDANLDLDGDGYTNLQEYLAGTDPTMAPVQEIRVEWYIYPSIVIAFIVGLLYIRKKNNEMIS